QGVHRRVKRLRKSQADKQNNRAFESVANHRKPPSAIGLDQQLENDRRDAAAIDFVMPPPFVKRNFTTKGLGGASVCLAASFA
ncbi:MAG TPA: hypothetical protein VMF90_11270, partial [Rhizobiaceae bacterium]|nr:hypothetical protein [Rhizobiaceae bacterium]